MRIKTRLFELNQPSLQSNAYGIAELAALVGVSVSHLYRVREGNRGASERLIAGTLTAFPQYKFEDLFYIVRE